MFHCNSQKFSLLHFIRLAHFQNGELSDEFVRGVDVCMAKDSENEGSSPVLLAISKNNVYDGVINKGYPTDLERTFIAIRKKNSEEVRMLACTSRKYLLRNE